MSPSRPSPARRTIGAMACGAVALATAAALTTPGATAAPAAASPAFVTLQVLAINDFHGNLLPPTGSSGVIAGVPAGGATYLSTHLQMLRDQAAAAGEHTVTVAAGDLIGASPLLSAGFHDEPTIEAMNALGLEVTSVGNHEFDEGWRELLRMQNGGCLDDGDGLNNANSCPDPANPFAGANFHYLSANVYRTSQVAVPVHLGQEGGRRQGRLHRDDAARHPDDRDRVRGEGPQVPRRDPEWKHRGP
jgi:5'-nucleotidase